jgi:hypothetical protein
MLDSQECRRYHQSDSQTDCSPMVPLLKWRPFFCKAELAVNHSEEQLKKMQRERELHGSRELWFEEVFFTPQCSQVAGALLADIPHHPQPPCRCGNPG